MDGAYYNAIWDRLPVNQKAKLLADLAQREPGATGSPLVVQKLADIVARDSPPLEFIVEDILPRGQLAMLGGKGKTGKSWIILQLLSAIDTGAEFLGKKTRAGKTFYLALEDGEKRLEQRPKIMRWQPSPRVDITFRIDKFDNGQGLAHVREAIATAGYDLVVIDTLAATLSGKADENNNPFMASICQELANIAHDSGCTILVVHHTSKQSVENPFDALRGASAIWDACDLGMMLTRKYGEREAKLQGQARDFDIVDLTLRQADGGAGWIAIGDGKAIETIRAGRVAVEDLQQHGEGLTAAGLAEATGKSEQAVRSALNTAKKHGLVRSERVQLSGTNQYVDRWYLAG